jgi:wobble nucleotide-excising tRNase
MLITRLSSAKEHRIFRDFTWPAELPDFSQFNLIYGWNGTGKTTLSNLFRHLQEKRAITEGEVQFRVDDRQVFGSDLVTTALPNIRVFNRNTVDRSIFEVPNGELPPIYFFGEDSAEKQARIESLKQKLIHAKELQAKAENAVRDSERLFEEYCTAQAKAIKNLLTAPGGGPYNNYNSAKFKQTANRLASTPGDILTDEIRQNYLETIKGNAKERIQSPSFNYPDFVALGMEAEKLLSRSVVASTIDELISDPTVAAWVGRGLGLHRGDHATLHCRFCTQLLAEKRMQALEAHFNDAFNRFQTEIDNLLTRIVSAIQVIKQIGCPR